MKPEVDQNLCIGCGACVSACPECFELDEHSKSHVLESCKEDCCNLQEVADNCPVSAISVK